MEKILLIDGQNFKGYIQDILSKLKGAKENYKINWAEYDFNKLLNHVLKDKKVDKRVIYFSKIKLHKDSKDKSASLIEERRLLKTHLEKQGFEVVMAGSVRGHYKGRRLIFREKGVDVRIAVDMVVMACEAKTKEIILASSDSDLQPAIKEIKNRGVRFIYLGFQSNPNVGILSRADEFLLMRDQEVLESEINTAHLME